MSSFHILYDGDAYEVFYDDFTITSIVCYPNNLNSRGTKCDMSLLPEPLQEEVLRRLQDANQVEE